MLSDPGELPSRGKGKRHAPIATEDRLVTGTPTDAKGKRRAPKRIAPVAAVSSNAATVSGNVVTEDRLTTNEPVASTSRTTGKLLL